MLSLRERLVGRCARCADTVHSSFLNERMIIFSRILKGRFDLISKGQNLTDILKMSHIKLLEVHTMFR